MSFYDLWADLTIALWYLAVFASVAKLLVILAIMFAVFINRWW